MGVAVKLLSNQASKGHAIRGFDVKGAKRIGIGSLDLDPATLNAT
jgi:hypothetical protein